MSDAVDIGQNLAATVDRHMFVALGTLSNAPTAIIASVAFVVGDPRVDKPVDSHYFKSVSWDQADRQYNFNTIQAMMGWSAMARKSVINQTTPVQVTDALRAITAAYKAGSCSAIWGSSEDLNILRNALNQYNMDIPWGVEDQRDIMSVWATLLDLGVAPDIERGVTEPEHVSLGDALFIARGVYTIYQGFRKDQNVGDRVMTTEKAKEITHSASD